MCLASGTASGACRFLRCWPPSSRAGHLLALALPSFNPPLRRDSVAGVGVAGRVFSASPAAILQMSFASWLRGAWALRATWPQVEVSTV